ncbi:putative nucleotidyltransferase, Ribonuclease H [Helianthus annuus]|nr:putative nucleotidyltransferase, Ribonuclease H [Helianthus annuus]
MNDLFRPHLRRFILVFFYDILIYSHNMEQHIDHLEQALALLHNHQFFAKLSKCCFGQPQVVFLGHVINSAGVQVEQEKISAIQSWPIPTSVKEVRGFLGLTGYYRRFVRNYGLIARPLTALTKKDGFIWSTEALNAFQQLKQALMSTPVLRLPDFTKDFTVECDASSDGVGAILSQEDHPVAYFSKGFSPSNRFKSAYDRELLALVLAVKKWNHYLLGRHFFIRTDHYTLKFLLEQQRLLLKLMPYDFSITHRAGKENKGADALSRRPHSSDLFALSVPYSSEMVNIKAGLLSDPYTSNIISQLTADPTSVPEFSLVGQLLFYKQRMVIPDTADIRRKLLHEAHATPVGGHGGFLKTLKRISAQYFWPKLKQDVRLFVQQCLICQQQKYETLAPAGLLQPLPIPTRIWEDISMDFIVGLPVSNRVDTILVVVDRLSKYAHFLCLSHPFTAKGVASVFCKEIVRLHGFPRSIISDRDVVFLSNFWQELFRLCQTKLQMSTSYHPQTDGQTEVLNRCLEAYLRCFAHEQPTKWCSYLPWAEYSYNTGFHTSTGTTPFSVVYGRDPPPLSPYVAGETKNADLEHQLIDRDDMLKILRSNLSKAQDRMRNQANTRRRELSFQEGDYVFLKIQPYRQKSLAKRRYEKLSPRFYGPYRVSRKVGPVAYQLELPSDARIHPVFHVSMLKPARGSFPSTSAPPLPITKDWEVDLQPHSVLAHRWVTEAGHPVLELLILWDHRPSEEATWENYDLLAAQFPDFRLEDKAFYREGSNDTYPLVYSRRKNRVKISAEKAQFSSLLNYLFDPFSGGKTEGVDKQFSSFFLGAIQFCNRRPSPSRIGPYPFNSSIFCLLFFLESIILPNIEHLDLSSNSFEGQLPYFFQNLTSLTFLDLSRYNLSLAWNSLLNMIPSLSELHLSGCGLHNAHFSPTYLNSSDHSNIQYLDLSGNSIGGRFPSELINITSLKVLDLSYSSLNSSIPVMPNLLKLDVSFNKFEHIELVGIWRQCHLKELSVSGNHFGGEMIGPSSNTSECSHYALEVLESIGNGFNGSIPESLGRLTGLTHLNLQSNLLTGPIPESLGRLTGLTHLNLQSNLLTGPIPVSLGQLTKLVDLDVSENSLEGVVSEAHLANLSMLEQLDTNANHKLIFNISHEWLPPFQLRGVRLSSCKIENGFPHWLQNQRKLEVLALSNASLYGLLPTWLQNMPRLFYLDLSHNKLIGSLINLPFSKSTSFLLLQNNLFDGSIPRSVCRRRWLVILDVSSNRLSGNIPDCVGNLQDLSLLILSSNGLSGVLPSSLGNIYLSLTWLKLNDNKFNGQIPQDLGKLRYLEVLDLGNNEFSGNIPKWIGNYTELRILRLHKNNFTGGIPHSLCKCSSLHILDIAHNNLTGSIPHCFGELSGMNTVTEYLQQDYENITVIDLIQVIKGITLDYTTTMGLVVNMDLSSNKLTGEIPVELTALASLIGLNLSHNHLSGSIPDTIGNMKALNSLDFSDNQLTGTIPPSMAALNFLSSMNLSHNNLSGRIPTGNQLRTLIDPSIYAGNKDLCGAPLPNNCSNPENPPATTNKIKYKKANGQRNVWFYLDITCGFATGFWGIIGVLAFKKQWRQKLFMIAEVTMDKVYVAVAVRISKIKRGREA